MSTTYLTVLETAERARVERSTIYRAIRRGDLAIVRFGPRSIRIPEAELAAYIERRTIPATVTTPSQDGAA